MERVALKHMTQEEHLNCNYRFVEVMSNRISQSSNSIVENQQVLVLQQKAAREQSLVLQVNCTMQYCDCT